MEHKIINRKTKEVVYVGIATTAHARLTEILFEIAVSKSKQYRIKYEYNYSDKQTIRFIHKISGYIHEFTNVPTKLGYFDSDNIIKETREIYENTYGKVVK